jgi:hypothetical protein
VTLDLIRKKCFLYDSSLRALDEPYEIRSRCENTGLIELSIDWTVTKTPSLARTAPMQHLDSFVAYMRSKPDVWFTTCAQLANTSKLPR